MRGGWRLFAAVILTTGSISSTSGAESPLPICTEKPPATAIDAIAGVAGRGERPIPYREEIYHPAFDTPVIAEGTIEVTKDNRFIRRQTSPVLEIAEVGDNFASMRRSDNGERNLVLVPDDLRPAIEAMKMMATGDATHLGQLFDITYSQTTGGWRVDLKPKDKSLAIEWLAMIGCGASPRRMMVGAKGGEKRVMTFAYPG